MPGIIEVSANNGSSWTPLTASHYLGTGQFGNIGNKFSSTSYNDWQPVNNNAVPTNSWWKHEIFDISPVASNASQVKIRFVLKDLNGSGAAGNYGWLIDNIVVTAAIDELVPPAITLQSPVPEDSVFNYGPFSIVANITDNSGIDSALLVYSRNSGTYDTVVMIIISVMSIRESSTPFLLFRFTIPFIITSGQWIHHLGGTKYQAV